MNTKGVAIDALTGKPVSIQVVSSTEPAKIPHYKDMDEGYQGQFLQHWIRRHAEDTGMFADTHERFEDDSQPLWYMIRHLHEKIHLGAMEEFPVPTDHVHLAPLALEIQRQLEELL